MVAYKQFELPKVDSDCHTSTRYSLSHPIPHVDLAPGKQISFLGGWHFCRCWTCWTFFYEAGLWKVRDFVNIGHRGKTISPKVVGEKAYPPATVSWYLLNISSSCLSKMYLWIFEFVSIPGVMTWPIKQSLITKWFFEQHVRWILMFMGTDWTNIASSNAFHRNRSN